MEFFFLFECVVSCDLRNGPSFWRGIERDSLFELRSATSRSGASSTIGFGFRSVNLELGSRERVGELVERRKEGRALIAHTHIHK